MSINTAIKKSAIGLAFTGALMMSASLANAATVFNLNVISSPTIGATSQGTVTLTEVNANQVNVVVALVAGALFVNTGGPHTPFVFNLDADDLASIVTVTSPVPQMFVGAANQSATPYGTFTNSIEYTGPNGGGNGIAGPLTFSVVNALGLTIADFIANAGGYFFAADILGSAGGTGSVAANLGTVVCTANCGPPVGEVPLPAGILLLISALGGMGFLSRFRKAGAAA